MLERIKTVGNHVLEMATAAGADETQVVISSTRTGRIGFEKNDFNIAAEQEETMCGIKVHKDQKKGSYATNSMDPGSLQEAVGSCLELARFSVADEYLCLPHPAETRRIDGLCDPRIESFSMDDLGAFAKQFIEEFQKDNRISVDSGEVSFTVSQNAILNSHGVNVSDKQTTMNWYGMGMGINGEDITSFDYLMGSSFTADHVREQSLETANTLIAKLTSCFGARKGEAYKGSVLLTPTAILDLLIMPIHSQISGMMIMDQLSRWGDQIDERVASPLLTVKDNPFDVSLGGAGVYDGEGVPTSEKTFIDHGVLKSHLDSTYTAKRRGTKSTGHSGFRMHGCHVMPGTKTLDEMRAMSPLLVEVGRFSGNVNPVTGEFSGIAKGSHLYKDGAHQFPLKETMIAGNMFDLLQQIKAVSSESVNYGNFYYAPYILAEGVSVSTG